MKKYLVVKLASLAFVFTLVSFLAKAQLPYNESFTKSTAPGIQFGGTPIPAFLTAGAAPAGSSFPVPDPDGLGYLRLTNSSTNQKGYIFSGAAFPPQQGLHIEVEYFVYGGSGPPYGADGICFFLFDGSVPSNNFRIGGFGGSLGYAPKFEGVNPVPGMLGGYIGVGLDEHGNFSNDDEGRYLGRDHGAVLRPGSVTIRGQGPIGASRDDPAAAAPNTPTYAYIASVQTNPTATNPPPPGDFNLVPSGSTNGVRTTLTSDPSYRKVIVDMQPVGSPVTGYSVTTKILVGGASPTTYTVINGQTYNTPPPAVLKYGIAASTGDDTNVHEIRNVAITVFNPATVVAPNAVADVVNQCVRNVIHLTPLTNDTEPNEGGVFQPQLLDLDPGTAGRQNSRTVPQGVFTCDDAGNVTFTPANGSVVGPVTCDYTITDTYTKVSNSATITLNDVAPPVINSGTDQVNNVVATPSPSYGASLSASFPSGTTGSWTQVAGTPTGTFSSPTTTATSSAINVSGLSYGNYTFRFSGATTTSCPGQDDVDVFINAIPVPVDDIITTSTNTLIHIPVINNDTDANGNNTIAPGSVVIVGSPTHGTIVSVGSNGTVDYRPTAGYEGDDSFSYTIRDDHNALSNPAIVTIHVSLKPSGSDDLITTTSNVPVGANINSNDNSPATGGVTVVKKTDPAHGGVTVSTLGSTVYTPSLNYHGFDAFTYALRNQFGLESDIINVNIIVRPAGTDDVAATTTNVPVNIPVKTNDSGQTGSTVIKKSDPTHGSIVILGDGTITYSPAADYQGNDTFTYALRDAFALESDIITVTVTIKPVGTDDAVTTNINTAVIIAVKDNDASKTGTTVIKKTDPAHGSAVVNGDGTVTYTPANNFQGTDVFTYALRNAGNVESDPITVTIVIKPTLIAVADVSTTNINTPVTIPVKTNDPDGPGSTVVKQSNPSHGTATVNPDGTINYVPAADFYGTDTFNYILQRSGGVVSDPTLVTVNVRPSGSSDVYTTSINTPITAPVKDNDVSKTGTTVVKVIEPLHGTATVNPDGTVSYVPVVNYYGPDSFTYILRLPGGLDSPPILVSVGIRPSGTNDVYTLPLNTTLSAASVKDNDLSKNGTSVIRQSDPLHGIATVNPDNTITYTPVNNYAGIDNMTYILQTADPLISDAVNVRFNIKPAGTDDAISIIVDTSPVIPVKDNDVSKTGTTVLKKTDPLHGTVVLNSDGTITYTPTSGYIGPDLFTYSLITADGIESDPINVTISISPKISALPDAALTNINTPVNIPVKNNDPGSTPYTVVKQSDPLHGTITINPDGSVTYIPATNYYGPDSFNYILKGVGSIVSDPTLVTIGVRPAGSNDTYSTPLNTPVTASVKDNDISKTGTNVIKQTDPVHGIAVVNPDNTITYTPANNYSGTDNLTYILRTADPLISDVITVKFNIKPVGADDIATTLMVTPVLITIKDNDVSRLGTTVVKKSDPLHGTAIPNSDGTASYTPAIDFHGKDIFTYTLKTVDGVESDPITVVINVRPVGTNDVTNTPTGVPVIISVKDNDPGKTGSSPFKKTDPQHGTIVVNGDGTITYSPTVGYIGPDTFTYTIKDLDGLESDPITVTIDVRTQPKLGLAKKLVDVQPDLNGSYNLKYLFTVVNYSSFPLINMSLKDDLLSVFSGADVKVISVTHQGRFTINKNFNGKSDIDLLVPASSSIAAFGEEQIEMVINIKLVSRTGVFQNSATVEGTNTAGVKVSDQSTDGLKPDPTSASDPTPSVPTIVDLKINPLFIPEGFSPNGDGINDYFVIQNTLDKPVLLEIYNRWNNLVYKSTAYQNDWDGRTTQGIHIGDYVPSGTYYYIIVIDNKDKYNGFITINR